MRSPNNPENRLFSHEKRAVLALSLIYGVRMLGLFMLIPVMVLYAGQFQDATPILIGVAVGIYGLTQAVLQIPFGSLSDYLGRHLVITGGLVIFLLGSLLAAYADNIYQLILGRALQGAGAIASAVMALVADSTRDTQRSLAMAAIGGSIGVAFVTALIIGPIIYSWIGGRGLFLLIACLAVLAIALLWLLIPSSEQDSKKPTRRSTQSASLVKILFSRKYLPINLGIFALHAVLTASFIAIPLLLRDSLAVATDWHWAVYLTVMGLSLGIMLPGLVISEKRGATRLFILLSALLIVAALWWLALGGSSLFLAICSLTIFFVGFNGLEAVLPSLISKRANPEYRGAVMGVFSTCQFTGVFIGGLLGGLIFDFWGVPAVFIGSSGIIAAWLLIVVLGFGTGSLSQSEFRSG